MANLILFLFSALLAGMQTPVPAAPPVVQAPMAPPITNSKETLGPSDVIQVTVWTGNEVQTENLTIAPDGTVFVPFFVNELVTISGMTPMEVRTLLLEKLKRNYRNPIVQVIPAVIQSKRALLIGERTGSFPVTSETSLLEFVTANGGSSPNANLAEIQITRGAQRIHANLLDVMMGFDSSQNIKMQPGDVVFIPSLQAVSNKIFVIADGRSISLIQTGERLTLLDALARSGGALGTNAGTGVGAAGSVRWDKLYIIRSDPKAGSTTVVLDVKFDDLYKKADLSVNVPLQNGDILYLPKARLTRMNEILTSVNPVTAFIQSTLFYGAIFRNSGTP